MYGSISGTVRDNSGGVLPGVTVTVTSVERDTTDSVVTNESGFYIKDRLLPGAYEVRAELQGFKQARVPSVTVSVDTQTPVDFTLALGELSETVEVTGGSPLLRTDRADVATTFDTRQLTDLPVLDRNFTKFVLLTPGTQQLGWQHAASENPQGSTQTMVNGQHFSGTTYQLDGTENRDPILGIIVINPTLESIRETKITSQNYDAEFGQATAGVVSVQTKSGANALHGSAFEFFQSDKFQSRNPFTQFAPDPLTGRFLPETKKNQFGGSIGGPIVQEPLVLLRRLRRDAQHGRRIAARDGADRRGAPRRFQRLRRGDLRSGHRRRRQSRTQFANNQIPQGRLSPQALAVLRLIPAPNVAGRENGTIDNYVASGIGDASTPTPSTCASTDACSDGLNTFGRYSLGDFLRDGPQVFGTGGGDELVSLGGISDARNQSLAYGVDHALSSSLLADFRFGWFKYRVNVLPSDFGTTPATDAGIRGLNLDNTFASGLPAFFIGGDSDSRRMAFGSGLGDRVGRCNCPLDQDEQQFQVVGNITKLMGNHAIKFGIDVRRAYNLRVPSDRHRSGELNFENDRTRGAVGRRPRARELHARRRDAVHPLRQPDHRRARAAVAALLLRAGCLPADAEADAELRAAPRRHQPADGQRAGQRRVSRSRDRPDQRRRRRQHRVERQRREHVQLGASPRRDLPADREDRPPRRLRQKLRHRRLRIAVRPQRHAEPAGAVGAGAERAATTSTACSTSRRSRRRRCSRRCRRTASSRCRTACSRARCRPSSGRRTSTRSTSWCSTS